MIARLIQWCVGNRAMVLLLTVFVVAAGVWTPVLLPELSDRMWSVGQPIFYFRPEDPDSYRAPSFPPWGADIPRSGWYGFPANPDGVV